MQVKSIAECSQGHSAILLTCIKRYIVYKSFMSIFEWLLKTVLRFVIVVFSDHTHLLFLLLFTTVTKYILFSDLFPYSSTYALSTASLEPQHVISNNVEIRQVFFYTWACRLSHNIRVVSHSFITFNYIFKLITYTRLSNNSFKFIN